MATATVPTPFLPGFRLIDGVDLNNALANPNYSAQGGITAKASGSQATSTALTTTYNNVTTVASANDGVLLPKALAGDEVVVYNNGANALKAFAQGTDTINGISGATGVVQAAGTAANYRCVTAGAWLVTGGGVAGAGTFTTLSASGLFTESAGGVSAAGTNQATGTALVSNVNNLTTVAASTGVVLPAAGTGLAIYVFNKGANDVKVYGNGSDTIDGTAGATGVTLGHTAGTNSCIFFAVAAATWVSAKLGAVSS